MRKLIEALKPIESKLTPEEKQRNSYGHAIKFIHNPQIDHVFITVTRVFHDIEHDQCYEEEFKLPKIENLKLDLLKELKLVKIY